MGLAGPIRTMHIMMDENNHLTNYWHRVIPMLIIGQE